MEGCAVSTGTTSVAGLIEGTSGGDVKALVQGLEIRGKRASSCGMLSKIYRNEPSVVIGEGRWCLQLTRTIWETMDDGVEAGLQYTVTEKCCT
jgi:hypothetical protein